MQGELNPALQQADARPAARGRKVTLVPRAIAWLCAGGRGSPLLCSQPPLQQAGTQHPPRRVPPLPQRRAQEGQRVHCDAEPCRREGMEKGTEYLMPAKCLDAGGWKAPGRGREPR